MRVELKGGITIDLGSVSDQVNDIVFDSKGRLVIAGATGGTGSLDVVAMRYNANGTPYTTFGVNGVATTDIGDDNKSRNLGIDSSGKILVSGTSNINGNNDCAVLRHNTDGSLDSTFGTNGVATVDFGSDDRGMGVAIDSSGMIVVVVS